MKVRPPTVSYQPVPNVNQGTLEVPWGHDARGGPNTAGNVPAVAMLPWGAPELSRSHIGFRARPYWL